MFTMNKKEIEFQNKLREETEIPVTVHEHMNKAYRMIENRQVVQKPTPNDPLKWIRTGVRIAGGMAAALAAGFLICAANPAMAENLPIVGGIFAQFTESGTIFGDLADKADTLEESTEDAAVSPAAEISEAENTGSGTDAETAYMQTDAGLTITFSEIYADEKNIYLSLTAKSDEAFPDTFIDQNGNPVVSLLAKSSFSFNADGGETKNTDQLEILKGSFTDEYTYDCVIKFPMESARTDIATYEQKYDEMTQQILDEMGVTMDDLNDETEEGQALLEQFNATVSKRSGALEKYKEEVEIPDSFTLYLDITQIGGDLASPETWDSGYTAEELEAMSEEEFNEVMSQMPEDYKTHPNSHENWWFDGSWSFELPVVIDNSTFETVEVNDVNDAGLGVKSVEKTSYELIVNPIYEEGSDSGVILVTMDAAGNLFWNQTDSQGLEGMDTSTIDIYFINYAKWMDELKGNYLKTCTSNEEAEERRSNLEQNCVYHTTVHFEA